LLLLQTTKPAAEKKVYLKYKALLPANRKLPIM